MYEVLNVGKINPYAWSEKYKLAKEDCDKIEKLRNVFSTVNFTR